MEEKEKIKRENERWRELESKRWKEGGGSEGRKGREGREKEEECKLFKSSDLNLVAEFFLMFHMDKPIDWLLDHILYVKVCNPEKDPKHCGRQKAAYRIRYKPSLFQHIGLHSSLKGKLQKLKDRDFKKGMKLPQHTNPPAEVSSTIRHYLRYTLDKAYTGQDIFWGNTPGAGDQVKFHFNTPIVIE
ncbi:alpha-1,3-mannosyl-glycoprotein 4-beta-N-acetylglucosaminyltransferase B-like, partial [Lytechinus pictus]